jgi:hypothetical protein
MKSLASNLWHGLVPMLYVCAALPLPHSRFRPLYRFNTEKGPFYIAEFKKRFYLLYKDEESFGSYATPEDAAEGVDLVPFLALRGLNVSALKIPKDLKKWEQLG